MSLKNSYTTSDYLPWDTATTLVRKLYRDKNYRISLLIGCGIFFGLRISDLLRLNWNYWCPIKVLVTNKIRADSICRIQPFMVI